MLVWTCEQSASRVHGEDGVEVNLLACDNWWSELSRLVTSGIVRSLVHFRTDSGPEDCFGHDADPELAGSASLAGLGVGVGYDK